MSRMPILATLGLAICLGCASPSGFRAPTREQLLPSGRVITITSCLFAWGVEHDERRPGQDSFVIEYVSPSLTSAPATLDQEALEVFELIRPVSEQWGLATASVSAFPAPERTGKYEVFVFSRSGAGPWTHTRHSAKVFNTDTGRKD